MLIHRKYVKLRGKLHKFYQVIFDRTLDDSMQYVKIGQKIRITFEGKTKNKRNQDVNLFKVEVAGCLKFLNSSDSRIKVLEKRLENTQPSL